ncbi:MAG: serine--tRNA ligase [Patescibacteria group bacterium]|nr:serine--tRNA ligase [Patescibacteria group bacterium]
MIDIKLIRDNKKEVKHGLEKRGVKPGIIDEIFELDKKIRQFKQRLDELRSEMNNKSGKNLSEEDLKLLRHKKGTIKTLEKGLLEYKNDFKEKLLSLPNLPASDVKVGRNDTENEILETKGEKTKFDFKIKDYLRLAQKLDLIDMERAAKVSGSRFTYLKGDLVKLQYALLSFGLDFLTKKGFSLIVPPLMIKDKIMKGLGYIEGLDEKDKYHFKKDGLYLIGTAEQSLIPLHANEILDKKELPQRYGAFTPAFRREAGSYGKDTKGILRLHQFDKLEMVSLAEKEKGDQEQIFVFDCAQEIMNNLKIPYRLVKMCTGDLVFPSARTFDIETWMPGQNKYRETHSCSTCTDFQARRLNIRYRDQNNQTKFVHTINGTALAMGRILVAIIENFQTSSGSIKVPKVLQKYCPLKEIK